MSSAIDQAFGIKARAMSVYAKRAEVLAANIANTDTPNFKARDLDFQALLSEAQQKDGSTASMTKTSAGHLGVFRQYGGASSEIQNTATVFPGRQYCQ